MIQLCVFLHEPDPLPWAPGVAPGSRPLSLSPEPDPLPWAPRGEGKRLEWIEPQCAKPQGLSVKHYSDSLQHSSRNAATLAQVILFTIACSPVVAPSPLRICHSFGVADRSQGHSRRAPHVTLPPSTGLPRRRAASETYFQVDPTSSERRDLPLVGLTSAKAVLKH